MRWCWTKTPSKAKLTGFGELVDKPDAALAVAEAVGFGDKIKSLAMDGGGWSLACAKGGDVSKVTGNTTWLYRCVSHSAYSCPAKIKIVLTRATSTLSLYTSAGWPHKHVGTVQTDTCTCNMYMYMLL